jgi:hypothetical protein
MIGDQACGDETWPEYTSIRKYCPALTAGSEALAGVAGSHERTLRAFDGPVRFAPQPAEHSERISHYSQAKPSHMARNIDRHGAAVLRFLLLVSAICLSHHYRTRGKKYYRSRS